MSVDVFANDAMKYTKLSESVRLRLHNKCCHNNYTTILLTGRLPRFVLITWLVVCGI